MSIDLPKNLIDSSLDKSTSFNYTPLKIPEQHNTGGNSKMLVRAFLFIIAVGIFTPTFIYIYRNSNARSMTSDKEYMEDIQRLSESRRVATSEGEEITTKQTNFFIEIIENIKEVFQNITLPSSAEESQDAVSSP